MLNIGTMKSRANQAFKTQLKRCIDVCYVQEATLKSNSTLTIAGVMVVYIILCQQDNAILSVIVLLGSYWIKKSIPVSGPSLFQEQVKKF